jgi:hypothetical protein
MKQKKGNRMISIFLCFLFACSFFSVPVHADSGPKPAVIVDISGLGDGKCYGTLLSKEKSTGPANAWDGQEDPYYGANGKEIWEKLAAYQDPDGFYFLQWNWEIDDAHQLKWNYYPPEEFKVLLYFPDTDTYAVSNICERYAFSSYYTVDMTGVSTAVDVQITAKKNYRYENEWLLFLVRVALTVGIEVGAGWLFGYRKKQQILLLTVVNIVTQILLNVILNLQVYMTSAASYVGMYISAELLVTCLEALIYYVYLNRYEDGKPKKWMAVVYAAAANASSYFLGRLILTLWFH